MSPQPSERSYQAPTPLAMNRRQTRNRLSQAGDYLLKRGARVLTDFVANEYEAVHEAAVRVCRVPELSQPNSFSVLKTGSVCHVENQ